MTDLNHWVVKQASNLFSHFHSLEIFSTLLLLILSNSSEKNSNRQVKVNSFPLFCHMLVWTHLLEIPNCRMQVSTLFVFYSNFWYVVWFYQQCNFLHQFLLRWVRALYISIKKYSKLHLITLLLSVFSVQIINRKHVNSFRCVDEFFMMYSSGTSLAEKFLSLLLYHLIPDLLDYF